MLMSDKLRSSFADLQRLREVAQARNRLKRRPHPAGDEHGSDVPAGGDRSTDRRLFGVAHEWFIHHLQQFHQARRLAITTPRKIISQEARVS